MEIDQTLFNWVVAFAGAACGWVLKIIWDATQDLKYELRRMDRKMHDDFVRRDDFKDAMTGVHSDITEIKQDMKDGFKTLNNTLGLIFKKLDGKEDK